MSGILSGRATVATPGTPVRLSPTSIAIRTLIITAETDNTNVVTVGGADVVGALATRKGVPLANGMSVTFSAHEDGIDELSDVYIDAITATEGVTYIYTPLD